MSDDPISADIAFSDLGLSEPVMQALATIGYESPSPIQAATIPHMLAGKDVLGQAQTGTGKTAAFALPILSGLIHQSAPQALVLAPTRELAIQVAEAFQKYAAHVRGFHVLPIYGGQSYEPQLRALKRGVHVVVGTPGRILDHMKRGTLRLDSLRCLVLDEADEMLRMGFIDDVETILKAAPAQRQIALFSATMPSAIRRIAQTYLREPAEVTIKSKTTTAANIRQRYIIAGGMESKLDALTRILEAEPFEGMIVFARTKTATTELAEKLEARGYSCAALNGDIAQNVRERTVNRLKSGQLDIIVATDVAARGLDVERISHVVNFDVPTDTESYVHRIGRTGRAGRSGEAILFVAPRERHMLKVIERATRQPISPMEMPTPSMIVDLRVAKFKQKVADVIAAGTHTGMREVIEQFERELNLPVNEIAAALAHLAQGEKALTSERHSSDRRAEFAAGPSRSPPPRAREERPREDRRDERRSERPPPRSRDERPRDTVRETRAAAPAEEAPTPPVSEIALMQRARANRPEPVTPRPSAPERPRRARGEPEEGMETYRIEVGSQHGVKPANIVGAIANEAELESQFIGRIEIFEDHSLVDLPEGMPKHTFKQLQKAWVSGQQLRISRPGVAAEAAPKFEKRGKPPRRT